MNVPGIRFTSGFVVALLLLAGCQSDVSLSKAVRKGDTVVVSLGDANPNGEYSNIQSTLLREPDINASILDSTWSTYPIKVRQVFRVYGDPTAVNKQARGQAQWMAAIDLVNPLNGVAPPLAPGDAVIVLKSDKLRENQNVKTKILPGNGTPHGFISQNEPGDLGLNKLEFVKPAQQALVRVFGTLPEGVKLAGAEYRFDIPAVHSIDIFSQRQEAIAPAKLPSSQQVYFEFTRAERQAPVGTDVHVALTATEGVEQSGLAAFDIVLTSDLAAISSNATYWQDKLTEAKFYDTEGQEIAGLFGLVGRIE